MMLRHMHLEEHARNIEQAVLKTIAEGKHLTADLGGRATNTEYTDAVIKVRIIYFGSFHHINHVRALELDSLKSSMTILPPVQMIIFSQL